MMIEIISLGGTFNLRTGKGEPEYFFSESVSPAKRITSNIKFTDFCRKSGANLTLTDIFDIRDAVLKSNADAFVIVAGTDSIEELVFALDMLLLPGKPVVVTGSMRPLDALSYDGERNLRDALLVAEHPLASSAGVLMVMTERVYAARHVRKVDSQWIGGVSGIAGPIADIRSGSVNFYYTDLPELQRYSNANRQATLLNVPILIMHIDFRFSSKNLESCDGLVLAGLGTGSLSESVIEEFGGGFARRVPVCLVSRCLSGDNYDDDYYKGSRQKYEDKGFLLRGFEGLSPLQARIKLCLAIADSSGKRI